MGKSEIMMGQQCFFHMNGITMAFLPSSLIQGRAVRRQIMAKKQEFSWDNYGIFWDGYGKI